MSDLPIEPHGPHPGGPSPDRTPVLRLVGITKRFGPLLANDDIHLELARGEVLALLGENGAGKSTLVSILFGHYVADAGHVEVAGQRLPPGQPRAALAAGVGMVHQHFTLADNLSVLDNVMLGSEPLWHWRSARAAARQRLLEQAARFGLTVQPQARVGDLSVGERQRVEILKALLSVGRGQGGARVLILDEPTAVLTPQESESLFATLQQMVAQGLSIVFISHKLDEVLRVSHRVAVLRAGRLVAQWPTPAADKARLAEAMVGRQVTAAQRRSPAPGVAPAAGRPDATAVARPAICTLRGVGVQGRDGRSGLQDIDLTLHAGEVVTVAGVSGNGQTLLAELLCGLRTPDRGELHLAGLPPGRPARARQWVEAGVARVPEDRQQEGVVGDLPLWENLLLEHYHRPAFSRGGWLKQRAARQWAQSLLQRFDVRGAEGPQGWARPARSLSGGNMQKLVLARVLGRPPSASAHGPAGAGSWPGSPQPGRGEGPPPLIVAHQPTWGLDVGAVAYVHQQLLDAAAAGSAVLVISEDLDEVLALGDRVAVMHGGRLSPALPVAQWSLQSLGLAMAGGAAPPEHLPAPPLAQEAQHPHVAT